jgi:chromosomal replication initiation ATPase DnaA
MSTPSAASRWRQLPLPFAHEPRFGAADLLEAPSNAEALAWLAPTAAWPQRRLALWGPEGCGKTHLLHVWAVRVGAERLSGATLPREAGPPDRPLAIDDADTAAELPLLHLLNASAEAGRPVLLAARAAPARWAIGLPDLASRLRATTAVEIRPPDDGLLRALLARLLAERQLAVAEPIQDWLLLRLPRTPAAMREVAARLDRAALVAGGRVTRAVAAEVARAMTESEGTPLATAANHEDFAYERSPASTAAPCLL